MRRLTPAQQIDDYIKSLKNVRAGTFMAGMSQEEELKYALHNKDRFIVLLDNLDRLVDKKRGQIALLDIGTSPLTFILKKRYPSLEITTLDLTEGLKKRCTPENIRFERADLNKIKSLPLKKKYDIILFLEVLEHLKSDHKAIINWILKILKDQGVCILQTPNKYSLKVFVLGVIGLATWDLFSQRPNSPEEFAHSKEYSLAELKSLVEPPTESSILEARYPIYFDTLDSSVVYRKFVSIIKPLLFIHYLIVTLIPFLRRGMQIIFIKNTTAGVDKPNFGLPPTPMSKSVVSGVVQEITETVSKYTNKPFENLSVLDAGCGWGEYVSEMAKYFGKVVGIEPQKDVFNAGAKKYAKNKKIELHNTTVEKLTTKQKFDLIVSLTVFEHVKDKPVFFKKMLSLLNKNGIIYLTAPNKYWLFEQHYGLPFLSWLPLSLANKYIKLMKNIDSYADCSYSLGYRGMKKFFEKYNCSYEFIVPFNEDNAYLGCDNSSMPSSLIRKLGIKLIKFNPFFWNFSKGFIVIIKKD